VLVEALVLDGGAGEGREAGFTIEGHPRLLWDRRLYRLAAVDNR
jgi:hypothetical protein